MRGEVWRNLRQNAGPPTIAHLIAITMKSAEFADRAEQTRREAAIPLSAGRQR
jgi:hypothetical protein